MIAALFVAGWVYFDSIPLPAEPVTPQASQIFFADGSTLLARVGITDRTEVPLNEVPPPVRQAVLAAEDRDFYHHFGISIPGILRAAWANASGGLQGASTITQQYARNAYLTQERSVERKGKEAVLAIKLERRYSKDEILERYLNAVYFGRGAYGIAAAAQAYFGKPVDHLTLAQGAVLAALIKDPWDFDPSVNSSAARARWQWIIDSVAELGWIPPGTAAAAVYPDVLKDAPRDTTPAGVNGLIVGRIEKELADDGIPPQQLHTAGLRVVSTIDADTQRAALDAVAHNLPAAEPGTHAALVAIEPTTGAVRAYYGGDHGEGFFDDAIAPRPPASTFKPVTLAAGLTRGISYLSHWNGSSPREFPDRNGVPLHNANDQQCPYCTLAFAMVESLNTPFYALAQRMGGDAVRDMALALGVPPAFDDQPSLMDGPGDPDPGHTRADITLGIYPVSALDLARVYGTFAAMGERVDTHFVASVARSSGGAWYQATPKRTQVIAPAVAADVTEVLAETANLMGAVPALHPSGEPFTPQWGNAQVAGKTGTQQWGNTEDNQDAWMAGYTPSLAAVVWIGRPIPGPIRLVDGSPIEGRGLPATVWREFLTGAPQPEPDAAFPPPAHLGHDLGDA